MFKAKTKKIESIVKQEPRKIEELEKLLKGNIAMYIDYANVRPWSQKIGWHVDIKRLKQFMDSFENIIDIKFYQGILHGDKKSEKEAREIQTLGYTFRTKAVKIMKIPIKADTVPIDSTAILNNFIRKALLRNFNVKTIEYLNEKLAELNKLGKWYIEDRKCNFDVELGIDMLLDNEREKIDTFVLWSGDSDFYDPLKTLLDAGKNVILFATAGRIARELNDLRQHGLAVYDIQKIRNFICWNKERKT